MKNYICKSVLLMAFMFLVTGCTHKITMAPDEGKIVNSINQLEMNNYSVGYYLNSTKESSYVVTPGGGGDKVGYYPYQDTESAFRSVLVKKFKKVYKLLTPMDKDFIKEKSIKLIFDYDLKTDSHSDSSFTWPPSKFMITINCKAVDSEGKTVWTKKIYDEGQATFGEFKNDFSLSAKRASQKVFKKLFYEIDQEEIFKNIKE